MHSIRNNITINAHNNNNKDRNDQRNTTENSVQLFMLLSISKYSPECTELQGPLDSEMVTLLDPETTAC